MINSFFQKNPKKIVCHCDKDGCNRNKTTAGIPFLKCYQCDDEPCKNKGKKEECTGMLKPNCHFDVDEHGSSKFLNKYYSSFCVW